MKITIEASEKNEGTAEPWWMIIDPRQSLRTDEDACYTIANMITGPFFSREEAQNHLNNRRYAFGKNAVVFCHSGCWTTEYKNAYREAEAKRRISLDEGIKYG